MLTHRGRRPARQSWHAAPSLPEHRRPRAQRRARQYQRARQGTHAAVSGLRPQCPRLRCYERTLRSGIVGGVPPLHLIEPDPSRRSPRLGSEASADRRNDRVAISNGLHNDRLNDETWARLRARDILSVVSTQDDESDVGKASRAARRGARMVTVRHRGAPGAGGVNRPKAGRRSARAGA